jgi:hypothetical protein
MAQWDAFMLWVDRVVHIRWQVDAADETQDRKQLEKSTKSGREMFEKRIGRYSQEWLSAIDRAIELRRTISAANTGNASGEIEEHAPGMASAPAKAEGADCADRRALVDAYIEEVLSKTGKRITRTDIWRSAGYKTRTEFEKWQRRDPTKVNKTADKWFTKVLAEKPHLKPSR